MCGFAGFLLVQPGGLEGLEGLSTRMANAIAHRGPDDFGAWADAQAGIALGHRRLSIVDLSPAYGVWQWAICDGVQWGDLQPHGVAG